MTHFDGVNLASTYLALFEKQIARTNIVKEYCIIYLLSLLPLEIINIIVRAPIPEANELRNYFEE